MEQWERELVDLQRLLRERECDYRKRADSVHALIKRMLMEELGNVDQLGLEQIKALTGPYFYRAEGLAEAAEMINQRIIRERQKGSVEQSG